MARVTPLAVDKGTSHTERDGTVEAVKRLIPQ